MTYIENRQIIDGPLIIDEIITWGKKKKKKILFYKVYLKKKFDSINWIFLDSVMTQMGFSLKWKKWINVASKMLMARF